MLVWELLRMFKVQSLVYLARRVMSARAERCSVNLFVADAPTTLLRAIELLVDAYRACKESEYCEVRKVAHPYRLLWPKEELIQDVQGRLFPDASQFLTLTAPIPKSVVKRPGFLRDSGL